MKIEASKSIDSVANNIPKTHRVVAAILPYLLLWKKTQLQVSLGLGAYNVYQHTSNRQWGELAYTRAWIGLSWVGPELAVVATAAANIVTDARAKDPLRFARSLVFAASLWFGAREWMLAAAAANIAVDGKESGQDFWNDRWIEGFSKLGLAAVRGYGAYPVAARVRRDWWGERLTQQEFNRISTTVDLGAHLAEQGYSTRLKGLRLVGWRGKIEDVTLTKCNLSFGDFRESVWSRVQVTDSNLKGAVFDRATFADVRIANCRLDAAAFFDSLAIRTTIARCDLTDVLLMNAKDQFSYENCSEHRITKPVVGIGWSFWGVGIHTEMQKEIFLEKDSLLYFVETDPRHVDHGAVDAQVASLMEGLTEDIPRQVLASAMDGPVAELRDRMRRLAPNLDAVFLPGLGDDIEPEWYGAKANSHTYMPSSKTPNVIRFSLLGAAESLKIPTWGICHGNQMINVWRGGTLQQHVGYEWQDDYLQVRPGLSPLVDRAVRGIVGPGVMGSSSHHQAIGKVGRGLEVFLEVNRRGLRIPKAVLSDDGLMLGTQIHPENFVGDYDTPAEQRNENFFAYFLGLAKYHRANKGVAEQTGNTQAAA